MSDPAEIFNKVPVMNHEEEIKEVSSTIFDNIIHNRRSVRLYTEEKVPEEVMQKVLEWATLAPNSSNLQTWQFYWVKDLTKKESLVKALFNQPAARTAQELIVVTVKLNQWKKTRKQMLDVLNSKANTPSSVKAYYEKLVPFAYSQGPLGIIGLAKKIILPIIGIFRPIPRQPTGQADMRVWAVKSAALACQNIMMGFSAYGYDTCPMEGYDSARIKKILGLGRDDEVVMAISVGKRAAKGIYGPRIRMPKEQFISIV